MSNFVDANNQFDNVRDIIQMIYGSYGGEIIADSVRLQAFYADLAPNQKKEMVLLRSFVECNGNKILLNAINYDSTRQLSCIAVVSKNMNELKWIPENTAISFCNAFYRGIGGQYLLQVNNITPPPDKSKRGILSLIALLGGIAVLISIVLYFSLSQKTPNDSTSFDPKQAAMTTAYLGRENQSNTDVSNEYGEKVEESTDVHPAVSLAPPAFAMPEVEGMDAAEAEALLTEKGLTVSLSYEKANNIPENHVISQSVASGDDVHRSDTITLVVCRGRATIPVPNVVGQNQDTASATLKDVKFTVNIAEAYDETIPVGTVISQNPAADTEQTEGAKITIVVSKGRQPVTVSFDANGGSASSSSSTVYVGGNYGTLPSAARSGYSFTGWYTAKSGGTKVDGETKVSSASNHTLYAQWSVNSVTVTFDANGGSVSPSSVTVTYDGTYGTLPTPSRSGYNFTGWYTAKSGGTKIDGSTKVSSASNHTLYAQWSVDSVTVTFDANGGSVSPSSVTVTYGDTYGKLPTPSRSGYNFTGWYTAKNGGTKVNGSSTVSNASNHTLYAHWEEVIPGYLSYYSAPSSLGSDLHKPVVSIEGDLYQFPCPVRVFLKNGWTGADLDDIADPYYIHGLTLTKNGKTLRFGNVNNPLAESTTFRNCVIEGIIVDDGWNSSINTYLPNNITLGSSYEYVMSVLPGDFKEDTDAYGRVFYRYTIYNNDGRYIGDTIIIMDQTNSYVVGIHVTHFYN